MFFFRSVSGGNSFPLISVPVGRSACIPFFNVGLSSELNHIAQPFGFSMFLAAVINTYRKQIPLGLVSEKTCIGLDCLLALAISFLLVCVTE